jgi:outer membrane autotransporter protein
MALAMIAGPSLVPKANAACGPNGPGDFFSPILCVQPGNASLTLFGPSTVTISNATGTQDAIRAQVNGNTGTATITVSDTTVINNDNTYPSIGIYALIATFTTPTGNAVLNLSGTNSITTANGTTVEANNRGTGASTTNITGTINVTSLIANTHDNDGIETTTHNGGAATLNMPDASGTVSVRGGNGILIESIAAGGATTGTIGSGMTISLDNTVAGNLSLPRPNSGILGITQALGAINLDTGATINTVGNNAAGIRGQAVRGQIGVTNSGSISTTGNNSPGIILTTTFGPQGPGGAISATNSGAIGTSGVTSTGILMTSTDGNLTIGNGGPITTSGQEAHGIRATTANAGASTVDTSAAIATSGQLSVGTYALGSTTDITVGVGGNISGGWQPDLTSIGATGLPSAGIAIGSNASGATLVNNGSVGALSDRAIAELDRYAIGVAGPLTVTNNGNVTGFVQLGAGDSIFSNLTPTSLDLRHFADTTGNGLRDTKRVAISDFGAGTDQFFNEANGVVRLAPVAGATTTDPSGYYLPTTGIDSRPLEASFYDFNREGLLQGQFANLETFSNAGIIDLRGSGTGNTLVITSGPGVVDGALQPGTGTYVANGGQLLLTTQLNDGIPLGGQTNSYSDMLVADQTQLGTAPTGIGITIDQASAGALTPGNGIEVVEVRNKTASAEGVFTLSGRAASGAFEYQLFRNGVGGDANDGNWYLRSVFVPPRPPPGPPDPPPGPSDPPSPSPPPGPPPPPPVPNYRVEDPLDMVLPALANRLGLGMLGSYHDRVGYDYAEFVAPVEEIRCKEPSKSLNCEPIEQAMIPAEASSRRMAAWGRIFGETGEVDHGKDTLQAALDSFLSHGPSYDFHVWGIQAGMDILRRQGEDGSRDIAGLSLGYARASADVNGVYGGSAGTADINAYSLGGYWTHFGARGWYVDAVLQGTRYDQADTTSILGESFDTAGGGIAASLEAGYPFQLGQGWTLEPQVQLVYQHVTLDDDSDSFGQISFADTDALYGRLGGRLTRSWMTSNKRRMTGWISADVWSSFGAQADVTFAALSGANPITFGVDLGDTWGSFGLGLSGEVAEDVRLFASGGYNIGFGEGDSQSWSGRVGIKVVW